MKLLLAIFTAVLLFQFEIVGVKAQDFDPVYDVADVMADLLKTAPNRPLYKNLKRRYAFASDIVNAANKHGVPELLLTVKVFNESSFRMDVWDATKQTYGLGQMHGASVKGCDTKTRKGQLMCAAKWMRVCHDRCYQSREKISYDGWFSTLSAYGTRGYCDPRKAKDPKKYVNSIKRQMRIWLKYEQQRDRIRAEIIDDLEHVAAERDKI